jgi:hypothetical protein
MHACSRSLPLTATSAWILPSRMAAWMALKLEPPPETNTASLGRGPGAAAEAGGDTWTFMLALASLGAAGPAAHDGAMCDVKR